MFDILLNLLSYFFLKILCILIIAAFFLLLNFSYISVSCMFLLDLDYILLKNNWWLGNWQVDLVFDL